MMRKMIKLLAVLVCCTCFLILTGCQDSSSKEPEADNKKTTSVATTEKTGSDAEERTEQQQAELPASENAEQLLQSGEYRLGAAGFYAEDRASASFSTNREKYKNEPWKADSWQGIINEKGEVVFAYRYSGENVFTPSYYGFQDGITYFFRDYSSTMSGAFFIVNSDGKVTYYCEDTDTEQYRVVMQYKDTLVIEKHVKNFSDNYYSWYRIDRNGKKVTNDLILYCETQAFVYDHDDVCLFFDGRESVEKNRYKYLYLESMTTEPIGISTSDNYPLVGSDGLEYHSPQWYYDDYGFYRNGVRVVNLPGIPENASFLGASEFSGDLAILAIKGVDNRTYVTAIDMNGVMQYDPLMVSSCTLTNYHGYTLAQAKDTEDYIVITPQGQIKTIGIDDLSELGKDAVLKRTTRDFMYNTKTTVYISDGFIPMEYIKGKEQYALSLNDSYNTVLNAGNVSLSNDKVIQYAIVTENSNIQDTVHVDGPDNSIY